jgi:hypothetical protein
VVFQRVERTECPKGCGGSGETGFTSSIWVVGANGSGLHKLVGGGRIWSDPHYSPDGARILIQSYDDGKGRSRGHSSERVHDPAGRLRHAAAHLRKVRGLVLGRLVTGRSQIVFVHYQFGDDHLEIQTMDADGTNASTVAECDPNLFCDLPSWGTYDGPLGSVTAARARSRVTASAAGRRARRLRKAIRRELAGRSRGASSRGPRRAW